jgi:ribosomal protein L28
VDYDENIQQEDDYNKDYDENTNEDHDEDIEDNQNDQIDEDELEDLSKDAKEDNPNQHQEQDEIENKNEQESEDEGTAVISEPESDSQTSEVRRSTRTSRERLKPNMSGKSFIQNNKRKKRVSFAKDELRQLEYCHNLVAQDKPDEEMNIAYGSNEAMLIARFIQDITLNVNKHGASFSQQNMLQMGLKVFGKKDTKHR